MYNKSREFKLQNGLNALYYPTMSLELQQLIKHCALRTQVLFRNTFNFVFAVKIEVEGEPLHLTYLTLDFPPTTILNDLATKMQYLSNNYAIIYNNVVYFPNDPANKSLINAIVHKIKPSLAVLVT
jgi:hypothetical protein